ncbi:MAG: hypothetical protein FJX57_14655 [Alphaproteobacteria bacterium]|nr:hypothetical protein [Alphaproteobacteria bacterium]
MFEAEARWVAREPERIDAAALTPLPHLGSSDRHFRKRRQPWMRERPERPLAARGIRVVNADLKPADGVDVVGDIFEPATFARLLVPFLSLRRWRRSWALAHWVVDPYLVSCVVLRSPGARNDAPHGPP